MPYLKKKKLKTKATQNRKSYLGTKKHNKNKMANGTETMNRNKQEPFVMESEKVMMLVTVMLPPQPPLHSRTAEASPQEF